jgi:hypothetical protein
MLSMNNKLCQSEFSRETEPIWCVCMYLYIYIIFIYLYLEKELAHMTMEAGKSKICKVSWQAGVLGKSQCWNLS